MAAITWRARGCLWTRSSTLSEAARVQTIQQNFPSLTLEQVYGAIAFYLGRQAEIDANIREGEEEVHRLVPPLSHRKPQAYARLQRAREQMASR
ncbi:MAG: hypothetical protein ABSG56_14415 [Bryobacteraceae bacterium]|jgi:hypothetical protein